MKIDASLLAAQATQSLERSSPSTSTGARSFADDLASMMSKVDSSVGHAEEMSVQGAKGEAELHEVALALEEADIAMRLTMKARNKVVEAYQEIMRMPV